MEESMPRDILELLRPLPTSASLMVPGRYILAICGCPRVRARVRC